MVPANSPLTNTTVLAASESQTTSAMLFARDLHLFLSPQTVHALPVHFPTIGDQFPVNPQHAETGMPSSQPTHLGQQATAPLIGTWLVALCAASLAQDTTCAALRHMSRPQATSDLLDRTTATLGAHQFPLAASLRISMSSAWSATSFFRREFSFCNALSCLAIAGFMPPYF